MAHRKVTRPVARVVLAAAIVAAPSALVAQLPTASASALALGDNFTALARGFDAVAWNPARLAMPGSPRFSFAVLPTGGAGGIDPVSLKDLKEYQDADSVPAAVRDAWLARIEQNGGERGDLRGGVTYLAGNVGNVGFQLSTAMTTTSDLSPGAAELVLFGNAGRTGTPTDVSLTGSRLQMAVTSTAAVSYAMPLLDLLGQHVAVGATLKYTVGHALVYGEDAGSQLSADPLQLDVRFPVVQSDTSLDGFPDRGHGVGLDLGAAWQTGPVAVSLAAQNVVNTFRWDVDNMYFRAGGAVFGSGTSSTSFDAVALSSATDTSADARRLRGEIARLGFTPSLNAGVAVHLLPQLTAVADVRQQLGDGMRLGERTHVGVGAELRAFPFVVLRAGASSISGGYVLGGGAGLELGPVHLNASYAERRNEYGSMPGAAVSLSFGN